MKRHVRSHRKSKDGCRLCRSRRVKCDENKPECTRCKKLGVECTYIPPKVWLFEPKRPAARHDGNGPGSFLRAPTGPDGYGKDPLEQRAFSFFRNQTAQRFIWTSPVSKDFFERFVPQVAVSEPLIWDVVVAMAMKHEEYASLDDGQVIQCRTNALAKYTKAVSTLANPCFAAKPDVAVLGAILLGAYFNMVEDSLTTGVEHIIHGQRILQENCRSKPIGGQAYVRACMSTMLTEVALVTAAYSQPPESATCTVTSIEQPPQLPLQLTNLPQAKRLLYDIFRYRTYLMTQRLRSNEASPVANTELLLTKWYALLRQFRASCTSSSVEAHAASHMMFQFKLCCMGLSPASSALISQTQIEVQSINLTDHKTVRVTAFIPGGPYPGLVNANQCPTRDDLDIWPQVSAISTSHTGTLVAITIAS